MSIVYIGQFPRTYEAEGEIQRRYPNKAIISQVGVSKSLAGARRKAEGFSLEDSGRVFPIHIAYVVDRNRFYIYT